MYTVTGGAIIGSLALDLTRSKVYFFTYPAVGEYAIYYSNLDGSNVEAIAVPIGESAVSGLTVDPTNSKLYHSYDTTDRIYSSNLSGLEDTALNAQSNNPYGLAIDSVNSHLYIASSGDNEIQRCNLDGTFLTIILTGLNAPYDVAIFSE